MPAAERLACPIAEEDALRARAYGLLARLLARPPDAETLAILGALEGEGTPFGVALDELAGAVRTVDVPAVEDEFHDLFIGVGGGALNPYGSYYLAGFLYERPLARLRADLRHLGVARRDERTKDPEDHIAMLCETMAGLITGTFGAGPASLAVQQGFFAAHLGSWAGRFFEDLEANEQARFYRPVGKLGRLFMVIEQEAFALAA